MEIIIKLLQIDDFYGKSTNIDIAKGYMKIPLTLKEGFEQAKRKRQWQLKKQ